MLDFNYNDGGRSEAGRKGKTGDCVTRAISIATGKAYDEIYSTINELAGKPVARTGVQKEIYKKYLRSIGWEWTATMGIGTGCTQHLDKTLPTGTLLVSVSRHLVAVVDHVIHDTHNPSRSGSRCVYGYWRKIK